MNNIEYRNHIFNKDDILNLYENNGWTNYTINKEALFEGIKNSLYVFSAYDAGILVG